MGKPESKVQKECINYLAELEFKGKLTAWRQNNVGVWDAKAGTYRKGGLGSRKGIPDIMGCLPPHGRMLAVEVKGPKGVQSSEQKGFQRDITRMGGLYLLVRDVEELKLALASFV
jgi:hypothetical protein